VIPDGTVEAAAEWLPHSGDCEARPERDCTCWQPRVNLMRAALEGAYPILLSHEREETRLAHLDAVVNAASLSKYEEAIQHLLDLADNAERDRGYVKVVDADAIHSAINDALHG